MAKDILLVLLCYVAFFISQFHFAYTTNVTCIESERQALLEFKGSLVDRGANRLASWTAGEDCCNWAEIICNPHTGHVQNLHLRNPIRPYHDEYTDNFDSYINNSLGGQINPSLLNLEHLTYLDLSSNDFSGIQIPTFLGSLKNLRYLNLSNAGFSSEIPSHLGNLSKLQYLDLGVNFDVYISSYNLHAKSLNWIIRLTSLKALDLSRTNLTECVDCLCSIGMIPSLSSLSLRGCGIVVGTAFSPDLSPILNLTSLVSLDLGDNQLMSTSSILLPLLNLSSQLLVLKIDYNWLQGPFPIQLEKLTALDVLDLSGNYFNSSSMLHSLCNHTNFVYLALRSNQLQGSLPHCLGNLTSLRVLDLSNSQLSGIVPSTLGQLTKLQKLDISYNSLTDELSESHFENLESLKYLSMSNNYFLSLTVSSKWTPPFQLQNFQMDSVFLGSFPPWLQTQKYVVELSMSNSNISGVIPTWFTSLSSIHILDLSNNKIEGSSISFPPNIRKLYLSNNLLTGAALSSDTNSLTNIPLEEFYLTDNHLAGDVPDTFCNLRSLRFLSLANNQLTGRIPLCFGKLSSLFLLSLANNQLTGRIHLRFGNLSSLFILSLANNQLTGRIPLCFGKLTSLSVLYLANNQLTGRIPLCFGKFSSLSILSLANNQLTGRIPLSLGKLSSLSILSLANNQLTGKIHLCFGNLRELLVLDLSNNSFSGHIPSTLGNLTRLLVLRLSRNKFYGVLPSSLKNLTSLSTLDLGENQLTGTIPKWIGEEFSQLQFLRLESNNFQGNISMHLCQLSYLKILNLAQNNMVGRIPHCIGNLTNMRSKYAGEGKIGYPDYNETLWNVKKGVELEYSTSSLNEAAFISLSTNNLHGEIPSELLDLEGLQSLNLSNNKLSGRIPENMGKLKNLESLDLAMNQLSGTIPQSLASIDTLSTLNLSFNNFVGHIPSGSHFDTLSVDQSIYEGNSGLCGKPLAKSCPDEGTSKEKGPDVHENIEEGFELLWFYAGIAPGFAIGSVGVFCILYFKKSWRHAYFGFVEKCFCNART